MKRVTAELKTLAHPSFIAIRYARELQQHKGNKMRYEARGQLFTITSPKYDQLHTLSSLFQHTSLCISHDPVSVYALRDGWSWRFQDRVLLVRWYEWASKANHLHFPSTGHRPPPCLSNNIRFPNGT
eukprot:7319880-Pyramimonas_sp.AAC.2